MNYFATKASSYISAAILVLGAIVEVAAPFQTILPPTAALYVGAAIQILGGVKALLSGSILPAIQSLPITGTPPSPKS